MNVLFPRPWCRQRVPAVSAVDDKINTGPVALSLSVDFRMKRVCSLSFVSFFTLFFTHLLFLLSLKSTPSFTCHTHSARKSTNLRPSSVPRSPPLHEEVYNWMTVKLKFNNYKTEAMIVSSGRKSRSLCSSFPGFVTIGIAFVPISDSFKDLGVTL